MTFGRSGVSPDARAPEWWVDQYSAEPFEQQQFGTAGVEGVKLPKFSVAMPQTPILPMDYSALHNRPIPRHKPPYPETAGFASGFKCNAENDLRR